MEIIVYKIGLIFLKICYHGRILDVGTEMIWTMIYIVPGITGLRRWTIFYQKILRILNIAENNDYLT